MADKQTTSTTTNERQGQLARMTPGAFGLMNRFADEMDRMFDDFGFGRWWPSSRLGRTRAMTPFRGAGASARDGDLWAPAIDVMRRGDQLVIRADLPGLKRDEITVDVTDDAITIQGERKREEEESREGAYRAERSYGAFCRVIPVPEGAITDQAHATFHDGVLEITLPAPPEPVTRGRRIEIADAPSGAKK